jgi:hypothetical protein
MVEPLINSGEEEVSPPDSQETRLTIKKVESTNKNEALNSSLVFIISVISLFVMGYLN